MMQPVDFDEIIEEISRQDPRYLKEAYYFLREALDYTQKKVSRKRKPSQPQHVSGQQLLQGIRDYALKEFGPMTDPVLREWGISRCEDFGEIVFNMVENGLLSKTDEDSRADFKTGYSFREAFVIPFLPISRIPRTAQPKDQPKAR